MAIWIQLVGVALAFFAGAFVGNFYHLIVHRLAGGGYRVILPPSCPSCGHAERRIWMLPILWYLILRGRCPRCGRRYRKTVVALEGAGGVLAALIFFYYGPTLAFGTAFIFCFFFLLNYIVEFSYAALVPQIYAPAVAAGVLLSFLPGPPSPLSAAAGGILAGGGALAIRAVKNGGRGAGPVAGRQLGLAALVGVYLGLLSAVLSLAAAAAAAAILPAVARKTFGRDPEHAFGVGLLAAALVLTLFRADIADWYLRIR
jgi:prepilin signal peptidase PulO-like enzyme (type II secretory pathway)